MALIICPECGKEVSDQAEVCIHCGYPIAKKEKEAKKRTYSLVLEKVFHSDRVVDVLCNKYGMQEDEAKCLMEELPCVLKCSMNYEDASVMWRDLSEYGWLKILSDEDAADPVKLREAPTVSAADADRSEPEKKEGMSFGMTVGAVILGVIAAIVLMSLI